MSSKYCGYFLYPNKIDEDCCTLFIDLCSKTGVHFYIVTVTCNGSNYHFAVLGYLVDDNDNNCDYTLTEPVHNIFKDLKCHLDSNDLSKFLYKKDTIIVEFSEKYDEILSVNSV